MENWKLITLNVGVIGILWVLTHLGETREAVRALARRLAQSSPPPEAQPRKPLHWGWVVFWMVTGIWGLPLTFMYGGRWLIPAICKAIAKATNTSYEPPHNGTCGELFLILSGLGIYGFILHTILKRRSSRNDSTNK
jgi:hypothetical protein